MTLSHPSPSFIRRHFHPGKITSFPLSAYIFYRISQVVYDHKPLIQKVLVFSFIKRFSGYFSRKNNLKYCPCFVSYLLKIRQPADRKFPPTFPVDHSHKIGLVQFYTVCLKAYSLKLTYHPPTSQPLIPLTLNQRGLNGL